MAPTRPPGLGQLLRACHHQRRKQRPDPLIGLHVVGVNPPGLAIDPATLFHPVFVLGDVGLVP